MTRNTSSSLFLMAVLAFAAPRSAATQTITGAVFDEIEGGILSAATVRLMDESFAIIDSVKADALGRFRFTGLRPGIYSVLAESPGFGTVLSEPFPIEGDEEHEILMGARPVRSRVDIEERTDEAATEAGNLVGRIVERQTSRPIDGVEVSLGGTGRRVVTDKYGMWIMANVPAGLHVVQASHLAYAGVEKELFVQAGTVYDVRMRLDPEVIDLEGLTVTAKSRGWFKAMEDVRFRMGMDLGGLYITSEEIDQRGNAKVSQILRGLPGVRVREGPYAATVSFRNCGPPMLWIDGVPIRSGVMDINMVSGTDIEIIEIYRSASSVPAEFAGAESACGALVIWTRRGD